MLSDLVYNEKEKVGDFFIKVFPCGAIWIAEIKTIEENGTFGVDIFRRDGKTQEFIPDLSGYQKTNPEYVANIKKFWQQDSFSK